jgi:hypothetical protein
MQKKLSFPGACWGAVCGLALCFAPHLLSQSGANPASSGNPKALLLAAAGANGAPGADAKPWHIKISFTLNSYDGKLESQGTFEEFWIAPDKFKRIYATTAFKQVEYTTPAGIRRTGTRDGAPLQITRIVDQFLHPIPLDAASIDLAKLQAQDVVLGNTKLSCIAGARDARSDAETPLNSTFCLSQSAPILRLTIADGGNSRIIRNGAVKFADRVFPQSVEEVFSSSPSSEGKQVYHAKLEAMESPGSLDEAQFTPPADAFPAPKVISLAERVTRLQRVHHSYPQYDYELPGGSRSSHVAGMVVIALQIHTDGSVSPLNAVIGPPALQQVSLEAAKKWTYKPFQQDGEPVEVVTTATLIYSLRP